MNSLHTTCSRLFTALMLFLALCGRCLSAAENVPVQQDYQRLAEEYGWQFDDREANPLWSSRSTAGYDVRMTTLPPHPFVLRIDILKGERMVYGWIGNPQSTFRIFKNRLYYPRFGESSEGGVIVAVDLTTGKELWSSPLIALVMQPAHSAYANLLLIDASDEVVIVHGLESFGNYIEFKDTATGMTVGHHVYGVGYSIPRQEVPIRPTVTDAASGITVACTSATMLCATSPSGLELWRADVRSLASAGDRPLLHIDRLTTNNGIVSVLAVSAHPPAIGSRSEAVIDLSIESGVPSVAHH